MAKKKRRKQTTKQPLKQQLKIELLGLTIFLLMVIAMAKLGKVGFFIVEFLRLLTGEWYMLICIFISITCLYVIVKRKWPNFFGRQLIGTYILFLALLLFSHSYLFEKMSQSGKWSDLSIIRNTWQIFKLEITEQLKTVDLGGGMIGALLFSFFNYLFASLGTKLVSFLFVIAGLLLITGKSLQETIVKWMNRLLMAIKNYSKEQKEQLKARQLLKQNKREKQSKAKTPKEKAKKNEEPLPVEEVAEIEIADFKEHIQTEEIKDDQKEHNDAHDHHHEEKGQDFSIPFDKQEENQEYELPPIHLLKLPKSNGQWEEKKHLKENAAILEQTFDSFGVKAKVTRVHLGPAVTKYEVHPDVGVKVSKIVNLSDDLALALAAKDIRIEAPIPGKSAIGIEVPNQEIAMVSLREVLDSQTMKAAASKLAIVLGRNISGEPVVGDLAKMPHLLVAGATGSGKSVCINGIITSILMRAKPHEVKLMMIDPKMVELSVYNGIPHLLTPVVTNPKKAAQALQKVVQEMERRYELFSHSGTRNIEGYNETVRHHNSEHEAKQPLLPYIVVIVDELADLMMVATRDVEEAITRLAQMARAAGIHLIIATQRPSVDVITGVIKANIPSRIAFSVSSQTDSRTILDMGGAEKLLGRGDMLFLPVGESKPVRIQGAFLSDHEVSAIVDFVIAQQKAQYVETMMVKEEDTLHEEVDDELYEEAVRLIVDLQSASVSMLQRRFRIGYSRAARLIDTMEANGIVGPYEGSKPRKVLKEKENN